MRHKKRDRPPVPLFREAAPPGYVLVERHLRRKPPTKKRPKSKRRR